MPSPQKLRAKLIIYRRCQVSIKDTFQAPLSPKLLKYVSYIEVNDEILSIEEEEDRLQAPVKKFAAYMRKFRKVKGLEVNTQQMWYESDYPMVSTAFKLFARALDSSSIRKLDLSLDFAEDYNFGFTEINWIHILINFVVKMKNLKRLSLNLENIYNGYYYSKKTARIKLLKRFKYLEKLEALSISNSGGVKKKEFELVCTKLPKVKHLSLEIEEDDDDDWDSEDEEEEGVDNDDGGDRDNEGNEGNGENEGNEDNEGDQGDQGEEEEENDEEEENEEDDEDD